MWPSFYEPTPTALSRASEAWNGHAGVLRGGRLDREDAELLTFSQRVLIRGAELALKSDQELLRNERVNCRCVLGDDPLERIPPF